MQSFKGIFSLLTTPFHEDGTIDWNAYDAVIEHHVRSGVQGLFAVCGTSQMKVLTQDERIALAKAAAERSSIPVVATANSDADQSAHTTHIQQMIDTGVDGIVLVPPPNAAADEDDLFDYYKALVEKSTVPTFLYEWPGRPNRYVSADMYKKLVDLGVQGIKDTTCTMEGISAKIAVKGESTIFQAHAPLLLEAMQAGADGVMAIFTTGVPQLAAKWWQAFQQDDEERLGILNEFVLQLNELVGLDHPRVSQYLLKLQNVPINVLARGKESQPMADDVVRQTIDWWNMSGETINQM